MFSLRELQWQGYGEAAGVLRHSSAWSGCVSHGGICANILKLHGTHHSRGHFLRAQYWVRLFNAQHWPPPLHSNQDYPCQPTPAAKTQKHRCGAEELASGKSVCHQSIMTKASPEST